MPSRFSRTERENRGRDELTRKMREEFKDQYQGESSEKYFVTSSSVADVVTRDRLRAIFKSFGWFREAALDVILQRMSVIVAILIASEWRDWLTFKDVFAPEADFLTNPRYTDADLPLSTSQLEDLPVRMKRDFRDTQDLFTPIVIEENTHQIYPSERRLPFLESSELLGSGSFGQVRKVRIAARQIRYVTEEPNTHPREMAWKVFESDPQNPAVQRSFVNEKKNLEHFKESLSSNQNIMLSFATIITGTKFNILSPLADFDLANFFSGDHPQFVRRAANYTPLNLFSEAVRLCHAIRHLHNELFVYTNVQVTCAHLDLKPDNILVDWRPRSDGTPVLVGNWKIADFGISDIRSSQELGRRNMQNVGTSRLPLGALIRETTVHPMLRGEGPFQPPETAEKGARDVSTAADMWSIGCILAVVLAFAIGGPEEVDVQQQSRSDRFDDYFYTMRDRPPEVKQGFIDWLQDKAADPVLQRDRDWIGECRRVILALLQVNPTERLPAEDARKGVHHVTELMDSHRRGHKRLWLLQGAQTTDEGLSSQQTLTQSASPDADVGSFEMRRRTGSWFKYDISKHRQATDTDLFAFVRFETPPSSSHTTLSEDGRRAAMWSKHLIHVYDLQVLGATSWRAAPNDPRVQGADHLRQSFIEYRATSDREWIFFQFAGAYIARVSSAKYHSSSRCKLELDHWPETQPRIKSPVRAMNLPADYIDLRVSNNGDVLIRFQDRLEMHHLNGLNQGLVLRNLLQLEFSGNGDWTCAWERDNLRYYWTVWARDGRKLMTEKRNRDITYLQSSGNYHQLLSFRDRPQFITCDQYGKVIVISGDGPRHIQNIEGDFSSFCAARMLPDDNGVVLIRGSAYARQKISLLNFHSGSAADPEVEELGPLYRDVDPRSCGLATIMNAGSQPGYSLLTLYTNGTLVRRRLSSP